MSSSQRIPVASNFSTLSITSSTAFTTTTSSGSTVPGPGALSGKAIRALGKATLRGTEFIIIRARLAIIATKFPLADVEVNMANRKEIEKMYDDLLELSRRDMYTNDVREKALHILLAQIGSRQTQYFIRSLVKWPEVEIRIFLSELLKLLSPIRLFLVKVADEISIQAYRNALPTWEIHSHTPFVEFLSQIVEALQPIRISPIAIHAVILDFLFDAFIIHCCDPLVETEQDTIDRTSTLYSACQSLLSSISNTPDSMALLRNHPLRAICSTSLSFTTPPGPERLKQRMDIWDSTSREVVLLRLHVMFDIVNNDSRTFNEPMIHDICLDSLELAGSESRDTEVRIRSLRLLHKTWARETSQVQNIVRAHLLSTSPEQSVKLVSQIMLDLSHLIYLHTPESRFFFLPSDDNDFPFKAVPSFLRLFSNIAGEDESVLVILLAADILGLMRPLLEIQLRTNPAKQIAFHRGDFLTVYDSPDFLLLEEIRKHGLKSMLRPTPQGQGHAQPVIADVLSRAFDVFLRRTGLRYYPHDLWYVDWEGVDWEGVSTGRIA